MIPAKFPTFAALIARCARIPAVLFSTLLCSLLGLASASAQESYVYHVPLADASVGEDITVVANVSAGWTSHLEIRLRASGQSHWQSFPFEKSGDAEYIAIIPGALVQPPAFDYFIAGTGKAGSRTHFASEENPHRVYVYKAALEEIRDQELKRFHGRRAQIQLSGELVDFGTRTIRDTGSGESYSISDSYYRIDTSVTYRLMRYPLRALRFGYSRLIGTTPATSRGDGTCVGGTPEAPCAFSAGYRAGGWVETQWRISDLLNLDTRALIQATPTGFGLGGRAELRFGDDIGSHFAMGVESITEVGTTSYVRLGWATVPRIPMAATIELSNYPSSHRDTGVRLLYDVAYEVGNGLRLGARVGYQARDQGVGGPATGLNVSFDF